MSGALNDWRLAVVEQLRENGLKAVAGMESARANRWREAAAAVSLCRVMCAPGGFTDYLGIKKDPASGEESELYGRQAELTLTVDIFAPRDGGEGMCLGAAQTVTECLICWGAAGLPVLETQTGRVEFLENEGLYHQEIGCRCMAWLVAWADDETGTFVDFEVKGRLK